MAYEVWRAEGVGREAPAGPGDGERDPEASIGGRDAGRIDTQGDARKKTSNAQDPESSSGLADEGKGALAGAGLRSSGDGSAGLTVSVDEVGRRGDTEKAA